MELFYECETCGKHISHASKFCDQCAPALGRIDSNGNVIQKQYSGFPFFIFVSLGAILLFSKNPHVAQVIQTLTYYNDQLMRFVFYLLHLLTSKS